MTRLAPFTNRTKRSLPILGEHSKLKSPGMFANPLVRMNKPMLVALRLAHATLLSVSVLFSPAGKTAPRSEAARQAASERSGAGEQGRKIVVDPMLLRRGAPLVDLAVSG
jgi:hypothetical protein